MVINQLIANREALIDHYEKKFARLEERVGRGEKESYVQRFFCEPGRMERSLGVEIVEVDTFYCKCPSIVFTHPKAYGYEFNHGKHKMHGSIRMYDVPFWGKAEKVLQLYYE